MAGPSNNAGGGLKFMKFTQDRDDKSETKGQTFFYDVEKVNGSWTETERYSRFEGLLVKLEIGSYEYEGSKIDTITFYMVADGITYKISMNMNYTTRSVFNSLLGNPEYVAQNQIVISTYMKDGFGKVWTGNNIGTGRENALNWKFEIQQVPPVKEVQVGGRTLKDDSELNEFFKEWLKAAFIDSGILQGVESTEQPQNQVPNTTATEDPKPTYATPGNTAAPLPSPTANYQRPGTQAAGPSKGTDSNNEPLVDPADDLPF